MAELEPRRSPPSALFQLVSKRAHLVSPGATTLHHLCGDAATDATTDRKTARKRCSCCMVVGIALLNVVRRFVGRSAQRIANTLTRASSTVNQPWTINLIKVFHRPGRCTGALLLHEGPEGHLTSDIIANAQEPQEPTALLCPKRHFVCIRSGRTSGTPCDQNGNQSSRVGPNCSSFVVTGTIPK